MTGEDRIENRSIFKGNSLIVTGPMYSSPSYSLYKNKSFTVTYLSMIFYCKTTYIVNSTAAGNSP